jgi:C4-dicarboxylate-specific signal transduction histidine kinase
MGIKTRKNQFFTLKQVYILIFLSLLGWSYFALHTMSQLISEQKIYATLINLSGKQRMLSQKTTLIAKRVYETNDSSLSKHLKELSLLLEKDHNFIINNLTSKTMKSIYFDEPYKLDEKVKFYLKLLGKFHKSNSIEVLKQIEEYSFDLLPKLNYAVSEFEKESHQKTDTLESRELFIFIGTIITLFLESIFIVIPVINRDVLYEKELKELNDTLEKKVDDQTIELTKTNLKLKELNSTLENKVKEKTEENFQQFQALQQQSKLAAMGEMVGAIAHQWRQPLSILSLRIQKLPRNYEKNKINKEFLEDFVDKNKKLIEFMSKTIDDFRNFFKVDKVKKEFDVKIAIEQSLSLFGAQLKNRNIDVFLNGDTMVIEGYKSEFQQVIINLISNSKDAFKYNNIENAHINITMEDNIVYIEDNAGGISEDILDRVFEPYFTTKEQGEGIGMGLYMSKMIIEDNFGGKLSVKNSSNGAIFLIEFS